jgi:hypothetical protein
MPFISKGKQYPAVGISIEKCSDHSRKPAFARPHATG